MATLTACNVTEKDEQKSEFVYQIDQFEDIRILRYQVPGFEKLSLEQKLLIYYLGESAHAGRGIFSGIRILNIT